MARVMTLRAPTSVVKPRRLLGVIGALVAWGVLAAPAMATDTYPCGGQGTQPWSSMPENPFGSTVQLCPLTSGLAPNGWIPVYAEPVASGRDPAVLGWLHGTANQYFVCQELTGVSYQHPTRGWINDWWAWVLSDDNHWGWVPEVFFTGGLNNEADAVLRTCPAPPSPPPPAPAPPPPAPKASPPPSKTPSPSKSSPVPPVSVSPPGSHSPSPPPLPIANPPLVGPAPPSALPPAAPAPTDTCDQSPPIPGLSVRAAVAVEGGRPRPRTVVTVAYGRNVELTGRVEGTAHAPVANSAVCVATATSRQAASKAGGVVVHTNAHGHFSYSWRAGPSSRLWLIPHGGGGSAASVLVRVRAPLSLGPSSWSLRNGETVILRGALLAAPKLAGVIVEMQARVGRSWQIFAVASTRRGGSFSYAYRFTHTTSLQHYALRAVVPAQLGYPFAGGSSTAVILRVSG